MEGCLLRQRSPLVPAPADDPSWCAEALGTQNALPFTSGIIVRESVKTAYLKEPLVARIDQLASAPWWAARSTSVSLARNLVEYQKHLGPVLRCANSMMFIDPHLDPTRYGYREFGDLIVCAGRRTPAPMIEIHRVCYEGAGSGRELLSADEIERRFRTKLEGAIRAAGLHAQVFVWDDFHDRFLISNLIGISAGPASQRIRHHHGSEEYHALDSSRPRRSRRRAARVRPGEQAACVATPFSDQMTSAL